MYDDHEMMQILKCYPARAILNGALFVGSIMLFLPMLLIIFTGQRRSEAR